VATALGVPRSTAAEWLRDPGRETVTLDPPTLTHEDLQIEILRLRRRILKLRAVIRVLLACLHALDVTLARRRLPAAAAKSGLLRAIERAHEVLKLRTILALIGLSPSRFHAWKRAEKACVLPDNYIHPSLTSADLTSVCASEWREP
jgi:hypothetical protein